MITINSNIESQHLSLCYFSLVILLLSFLCSYVANAGIALTDNKKNSKN